MKIWSCLWFHQLFVFLLLMRLELRVSAALLWQIQMMGPMLCSIVLAVTLTTTEQTPKQDFQGRSRELKVGSEGNAVRVCMDFSGHCKSSGKIQFQSLKCAVLSVFASTCAHLYLLWGEWQKYIMKLAFVVCFYCASCIVFCVKQGTFCCSVFVMHFVSDHWDNGLRCFCFLLLLVGFFILKYFSASCRHRY